MEYSLDVTNFLGEILVFPILLFSSISLHVHLRRTSSFTLLFFGIWVQKGIPFLFFDQLFVKASSDNFTFLHLLFFWMYTAFLYNVTNLHP